jgi:hypothetical protein
MTIAEHLEFIATALTDWAQETKGRVEIAEDPVHLLGLLATSPGSFRAVVMFDSEEKRGEFEESGGVDRKFIVVVSKGRGFTLQPGDALVRGSAGSKPLFNLVEEGREVVRGLRFTDEGALEAIPDYKATRRVQLEESTVDAYQIEFTTGVQLPIHANEA